MITLKTFVFNPFQENTYILHDETKQCIIVDPGCYEAHEKAELDKYISDNQLQCIKLVNTHCHVDHVLGSLHVAVKYKPEILVNKNDEFLINEAKKHGIVFGFIVEQPPLPTSYIEEDSEITFGNSTLKVLFVPGHSPGSVALYSANDNFVITGDALFKGSIGRTDLPGGDYDILMKSIMTKLMTLPPDTAVFPGHGPSTSIHEEALSNPFLGA
jgi:glyoxylase-like metal-dependent hydrolase (beta-lactamase superfamily II)